MGGMGCHDGLTAKCTAIFAAFLQQVEHVPDENLLELSVHVRLRFLDKYQMQRRTILFICEPFRMKIQYLDHHINQVLKSEAIITVWKSNFILALAKNVVHPCILTVFLFGPMIDDHLEWDARIML